MNPMLIKAGVAVAKDKRTRKAVIGAVMLGMLVPMILMSTGAILLAGALGVNTDDTSGDTVPVACRTTLPDGTTGPAGLDATQMSNAATIIEVGKSLDVPPRGWVVAIATARQEANILNLASRANPGSLAFPHDGVAAGDHDSVGIFQQRDAWGPMADRMDVAKSARMFYTGGQAGQRGLLDIPGWQDMSIAEASQAVQVSLYPSAYAQWEALAVATVSAISDIDVVSTCAAVATGPWTHPITPGAYTISSVFLGGFRSTGGHSGTDFAAVEGTPIFAASTGVVTFADWEGAYGWLTKVRHADGVTTYYAHQSTQAVQPGDRVEPGDVIGTVGSTGNSSGPHLHFEVRLNDSPIDPVPFLRERDVNP